jgi:predicted phosphodiesterase
MEVFNYPLEINGGERKNIYFLGDIHEGNVNHAEADLRKAVKIIKNDPDGLWIGMGDYIEAITIDDKRFDPLSVAPYYRVKDLKDFPNAQLEYLFKKLKPIDSKCIALLIGNHEESYVKHNHSDVYNRFFEMFDSKPKKIGYVGFVRLLLHRNGFTKSDHQIKIALNHGDGGTGFREGYALNKVHDIFRGTDADVCVMGHIHQLAKDRRKIVSVSTQGKLDRRVKYWGVSGCFLYTYVEGNKNYFEHKGRYEGTIGMLKLEITQVNHRFSFILKEIELN